MISTWEILCLRGPVARLWYGGGSSYLDGHVLVFPDIPDICAGTSTAFLAENAPGLPGAGLLFLSNLLSGTNLQTASFRFRMVGHADCKTTNGHPQALFCFSFRGSTSFQHLPPVRRARPAQRWPVRRARSVLAENGSIDFCCLRPNLGCLVSERSSRHIHPRWRNSSGEFSSSGWKTVSL